MKLAALALLLAGPLAAQVRLTPDQTRGLYISGPMAMVGITQDSLAALVGAGLRSATTSRSSRIARLSALRRGTVPFDSLVAREYLAVGWVLDSLWRARADTVVEPQMRQLYRLVLLNRAQRPVPQ